MTILTSTLLGLLTLFSSNNFVAAVPPPNFGFPEAPNDTVLAVAFSQGNGSYTGVTPGILFGSQVANVTEPVLALNLTAYSSLRDYNGSWLSLMVDPDASYPESPTSRFILHYLQANQTLEPSEPQRFQDSNLISVIPETVRLLNNSAATVPYMGPKPPTNSSAHRYILYTFKQASGFKIPSAFSGVSAMNRTKFNLTEFIAQSGLGTPAAANYFYASTQSNVPERFVGAAGSSYPGGNGGAVTSGDPGKTAVPSATSSSSQGAGAARATAAGGLLGAGLVGLVALL